MTAVTCGTGTTHPSEAPEFTLPKHQRSALVISGAYVAQTLIFYVMFCRSLFILFLFIN